MLSLSLLKIRYRFGTRTMRCQVLNTAALVAEGTPGVRELMFHAAHHDKSIDVKVEACRLLIAGQPPLESIGAVIGAISEEPLFCRFPGAQEVLQRLGEVEGTQSTLWADHFLNLLQVVRKHASAEADHSVLVWAIKQGLKLAVPSEINALPETLELLSASSDNELAETFSAVETALIEDAILAYAHQGKANAAGFLRLVRRKGWHPKCLQDEAVAAITLGEWDAVKWEALSSPELEECEAALMALSNNEFATGLRRLCRTNNTFPLLATRVAPHHIELLGEERAGRFLQYLVESARKCSPKVRLLALTLLCRLRQHPEAVAAEKLLQSVLGSPQPVSNFATWKDEDRPKVEASTWLAAFMSWLETAPEVTYDFRCKNNFSLNPSQKKSLVAALHRRVQNQGALGEHFVKWFLRQNEGTDGGVLMWEDFREAWRVVEPQSLREGVKAAIDQNLAATDSIAKRILSLRDDTLRVQLIQGEIMTLIADKQPTLRSRVDLFALVRVQPTRLEVWQQYVKDEFTPFRLSVDDPSWGSWFKKFVPPGDLSGST